MSSVSSELHCSDGIYTLLLNDPSSGNAINTAMAQELEGHLLEVEKNPGAVALVLTGAGDRFFSSGGNLKQYMDELTSDALQEQFSRMRGICDRIDSLPIPTIAAINGKAIGGGVELALACDLRVIHDGAYLQLPQVRLGVLTAWDGHIRLVRLVGESVALDLLVTARVLSAAEALAIGLVNRVASNAVEVSISIAEELSLNDQPALQVMKKLLRSTRSAVDETGRETARREFWQFWPPKKSPLRRGPSEAGDRSSSDH